MSLRSVIFIVFCVVLLPFSGKAQGTGAPISIPFVFNKASIEGTLNSPFMNGPEILDAAAIRAFYKARSTPVWQGMFDAKNNIAPVVEILKDSWTHGLNPAQYHIDQITTLSVKDDFESRARLEILMTDAVARYIRDMSGMRVNAAAMGLDVKNWVHPYTPARALEFLNEQNDILAFLKNLPPKSFTYKALRDELIRLSNAPEEEYMKILPLGFGGVTLKPMMRHARVPDLRLRLGVEPQTTDELLYDDRLAAAVIKFQHTAGQKGDAIVGPTTLKLLNRSNRGRILQVIANLERLRWVNENRPARFVLVNIPSASLWAIENGQIALEMPVIVGKTERPTQSFIANITGVRFNPGWTVPPTIKKKDIWPKLKENPNYLTDKGMELIQYTPEGRITIDPVGIDWNTLTENDLRKLEMVQIPGKHNPLGQIRVLMPNKFDIYLHDTNQPEYFDRALRAHSSGCVRMQEPQKMAAFILQHETGWTAEKMARMIEAGKTRDILIKNPIPVYLLYYTVWVGDDGKIAYGNDIYDLDPRLIELLAAIDGFAIPGHNLKITAVQAASRL
jgi:murein L,D-transpeptidase YcbB/YkuD